MKTHLGQLRAEGMHLGGAEGCPRPECGPEGVRGIGPRRYNLEVGISEGALWANGELTQPVELHCVRCLEAFPYDIRVNDFSLHTELTGPEEVDLTPFMREDVLLNLPPYPHCDREGGRICPVPEAEVTAEDQGALEARPPDWSALDKLDL